MSRSLSRRAFLKTASSGTAALVIGFYFPLRGLAQGQPAKVGVNPFNAWVRIAGDGGVTILMPKSEMGQGVMTSLPMILAEELEVDWRSVTVEQAPTNPDLYRHGTGGSTSVYRSWLPLRRAGATAREMLITAASESWSVPRGECKASGGAVIHASS
jgi:isoquinoline 1-oxidoreductase beta subunit